MYCSKIKVSPSMLPLWRLTNSPKEGIECQPDCTPASAATQCSRIFLVTRVTRVTRAEAEQRCRSRLNWYVSCHCYITKSDLSGGAKTMKNPLILFAALLVFSAHLMAAD